jgi:hypothetical protein
MKPLIAGLMLILSANSASAGYYEDRTFEGMTPDDRRNFSASSYALGCMDAAVHDYHALGHESVRVGIIDEITAQCHSDAVSIARQVENWLRSRH